MRSIPKPVTALALAASLAATTIAEEKVIKGPVTQNVRTDRATLTWVTQGTFGAVQSEGSAAPSTLSDPAYHEMELTGLKPGTRYQYSLTQYGSDVRGSFVTAPADDAPYTFIVFGDTRTRHDFHRRIAQRILAERPSFVLHTGDLVNNGLRPEDWDVFFEIERELLRQTAFYPAVGNHERNAPVYFKYFAFPEGNGHYYSFDWGNSHFIALNSNQVGDTSEAKAAFLEGQLAWLKADLKRNQKPFTWVYFHHPLYSAVERRKESAAKLREVYEPILREGQVTGVFAGHDHNYQHHVAKGIHHIVTGGGGAPLYDVDPIPDITLKAVKIENYVRITVHGNRAKAEAIDIDGNLLEAFEMVGRAALVPAAAAR